MRRLALARPACSYPTLPAPTCGYPDAASRWLPYGSWVSERLPPFSQWCPPEITDAAIPIQAASDLLKGLREELRRLQHFGDSSPSSDVRSALSEFLERWDQASYYMAGAASGLALNLRAAAMAYEGTEADLARRLQLANPDHEG